MMTSYILQYQISGESKPNTLAVYTTQSAAISKMNELVISDISVCSIENPESTFDQISSTDGLIVFIRKSDTISFQCSFGQTLYPEVTCSTTGQTLHKAYGVVELINP